MQEYSNSSPSPRRIVAAFIITPLLAAFVLACIQPLYAGLTSLPDRIFRTTMIYSFFGAYPAALVFGLPAFMFLRRRVKASILNCAFAGAIVASLPWLLLGLISNPEYAYSNGHVTHQNGAKTWAGWVDLFGFVGAIATLGAAAGMVFWIIAVADANGRKRVSALARKRT